MVRAKSAPARLRSNKRVMKAAKGAVGARGRLRRTAMENVQRGLQYAFHGRKLKKRDQRALWITRINAACRMRGLPYNRFIEGLAKAKVTIDRKHLAEVAAADSAGFDTLVTLAKKTLGK